MMMNYITVLLFSNKFCTPRPDLCETPRSNSDLVLSVVGSASRNPITGCNRVGFTVVSPHATLVSGSLPRHYSAQAAVLAVLMEACKLAKSKTVTIYTDPSARLWANATPANSYFFDCLYSQWSCLCLANQHQFSLPSETAASMKTILSTNILFWSHFCRPSCKNKIPKRQFVSKSLFLFLFPQHLTGVIVHHLFSTLNFFQPWLLRHFTSTIRLHKYIFSVACRMTLIWFVFQEVTEIRVMR